MSRIGKQPVNLPEKVTCQTQGQKITVKGPLGELSLDIPSDLSIETADKQISLKLKNPNAKAIWGLERALLANIVKGVSEGFSKRLEIEGVGYRAQMKGKDMELQLGFSHPVIYPALEGITLVGEKNIITVSGINKQKVGQVAAEIRELKPPEPYKGKGIHYQG